MRDASLGAERSWAKTLAEKVWDEHVVRHAEGEPDLMYVDIHLVHEVTSPQAFDGLRLARAACSSSRAHDRDRRSQRSDDRHRSADCRSGVAHAGRHVAPKLCGVRYPPASQWATLRRASCTSSGPQLGLTQPGMTIVCGDSHTSTHGAFGALAFGIGTSEVEHVLATQTLPLYRPRTMAHHRQRRSCRMASRARTSSSP